MKKKASTDHHGGAWKVAYGDFITSLMCLFMVLWILTQNVEIKESMANYFLDPFSAKIQRSPGVVTNSSNYPSQPDFEQKPPKVQIDQAILWEMAQQLYKKMKIDVDDVDRPIDIQLNSDGMFITLFDRDDQPIFVRGTNNFTQWGDYVMENIAWLLAEYGRFPVKIATHVPAGQTYPDGYSDFKLTSDMANSVKDAIVYYAVPDDQILRVTGYGDNQGILEIAPDDPRNQRIELELTIPGSDDPKIRPTPVRSDNKQSFPSSDNLDFFQ